MNWLKKILDLFSSLDPAQLQDAIRLIGELKEDFDAFKTDILEAIDLIKEIWGPEGTTMRTMEDVEALGLLNGKSGPLREAIKFLMEHPELLEQIMKLIPILIPLLT